MTKTFLKTIAAGAMGAMMLAGAAMADPAQSKAVVDAAKAQGVVGEQSDGFLGLVRGDAGADVRAALNEINAGRADLYRQAAAKNGDSVEAAGVSAFQTAIQARIKPGEYVRDGGAWVKK